MFTYSLCMIVKNEEQLLTRCLDSFAPLFDEIVIVDTGSTDDTKEIAVLYTEHIYDFKWNDDFAAARNFAFSKCTGDYIYSCDADEVLDAENAHRFRDLMRAMLPEVEIVQMKYVDPRSTVLNTKKEWRPKLFKRLRPFLWIDPVHETVRLEPVVFDSDIEIQHLPEQTGHEKRDFSIFQKAYKRGVPFSKNLYKMYATELYKCGDTADFKTAIPVFTERLQNNALDADSRLIATSALCHAYRLTGKPDEFFKMVLLAVTSGAGLCSEICFELGEHYHGIGDFEEAKRWFLMAIEDIMPVLDVHTGGDLPLWKLAECEEALGRLAEAEEYRKNAGRWEMGDE